MITQKELKNIFDYRKDGALIYRKKVSIKIKIGEEAGSISSNGYLMVSIQYRKYLNHRLVWLWHKGSFPKYILDHIDRNKHNNSIENLREVNHSCNSRNTGNREDNTSGIKGVHWDTTRHKWVVNIRIEGKTIYLGGHACLTEAAATRLAAEQAEDWPGCYTTSPAYMYLKENICQE